MMEDHVLIKDYQNEMFSTANVNKHCRSHNSASASEKDSSGF